MNNIKKGITLLVLLFSIIIPVGAFAAEFPDLPGDYWARREILQMSDFRIILGMKDGSFYPDKPVTRAEFATIIAKSLNLPLGGIKKSRFTDVANQHWAMQFIEAAAKAGYVSGYQGKFRPGDNISRQEMIVIVMNISKKYGYSGDESQSVLIRYKDGQEIAPWAVSAFAGGIRYDYIREIVENDTVAGAAYRNNWINRELKPAANATRAEAAYAVYKMLIKTGIK